MDALRYSFRVLVLTIKNFVSDSCLRHAAALSFYTLFSLAPMVMLSVLAASLFAAEVDFQRELVEQFSGLVGEQGAEGVTVLLQSLENEGASRWQIIFGLGVLMFSATNIFVQLQAAFNEIFSVVASGRGIIKLVLDRLISLGIILSLGFIMILSLVIDSSILLLKNWLVTSFPDLAVFFIGILQYVLLASLGTLEIYALLNFLPDVHLPRRYKVRGCAFIALALILGKSIIGWYIGNSRLGELGGASASVLVLMLWVYYSSMIVFFGTELIKSMGILDNVLLQPKRYAVRVQTVMLQDEPVIPPDATAAEGEQADKEAEQAVEAAAARAEADHKAGIEPELPAKPDALAANTAVDPAVSGAVSR